MATNEGEPVVAPATPPPTPPPVAEGDKMVVYIFVHPTINDEGIIWHLQQLSESQNYIEKVVFIESYNVRPNTKEGTIEDILNKVLEKNESLYTSAAAPMEVGTEVTDNIDYFIRKQYYPPTPEKPEQYLPNLNLELDLDGYTNYFKNVRILKVEKPYENRLNIEKKLQKLKIRIKVEKYFLIGKGRTTGIGCKRFLSQLLHLKFNPNMLYCAIDGFTTIKQVPETRAIGPYEDSDKKYSDVISKYYDHKTETFGIVKGSEDVTGLTKQSLNSVDTVLQKFIILKPTILTQVFYDPLCTDFKEDVDFFHRLHQVVYIGTEKPFNKYSGLYSCKLIESETKIYNIIKKKRRKKSKAYIQTNYKEKLRKGGVIEGMIDKYERPSFEENFENYRYVYRRFLIDAILNSHSLQWYAVFSDNHNNDDSLVHIIPNISEPDKRTSILDLELHIMTEGNNKIISHPSDKNYEEIFKLIHSVLGEVLIFGIKGKSNEGRCYFKTYGKKFEKLLIAMGPHFLLDNKGIQFDINREKFNLGNICASCDDKCPGSDSRKRKYNFNVFANGLVKISNEISLPISCNSKSVTSLSYECVSSSVVKVEVKTYNGPYKKQEADRKRKMEEMGGGSRKHTKKRQFDKKTKKKIHNKSKNNRTKKTNKKKTHKK